MVTKKHHAPLERNVVRECEAINIALLRSTNQVFAPEEQNVYSPDRLRYPAPLGAECAEKHHAPLERNVVRECDAINIALLRSTNQVFAP